MMYAIIITTRMPLTELTFRMTPFLRETIEGRTLCMARYVPVRFAFITEFQFSSIRQIPLKRFGQPEEVSHLLVFLASDLASYINGQTIVIDGGLT